MTEGLQSAELNARRRFAAFISYAHADSAIAAKLQARLERYRLPKHLALSHADGQAALGQIFRDREDLAAAPSLSDAIRAAIAQAEALIVICSPDAVASRWVGEEIALFRSLHPDRPILAAVVRGTPAESFPAALTEGGTEPLAADLRKEADGEALGFLKIVAGIAGVPLDALVQRDAQRRIRRVMWITVGAIAAMLIMGIMTTLALSARNEAARQRESAEGLVEYMLTDLREKLKGVGRLDVMEGVNQRAMDYYGGESNKGQLLNAQTLHAMGEDFEKRGELDKALAKFRQAYGITAALLQRDTDHADVVFAHAQSESWIGRIAELKGDWKTAKQHFDSYRILSERLQRLDNNKKRAVLEVGHAELNLGIVAIRGRQDNLAARTHFVAAQKAYNDAANLARETDQQVYFRANAEAWLADTFFADADWRASLAHRRAELSLNERVAQRDPENADAAYLVAKTRLALGKSLLKSLKPSEAETVLDSAKAGMAKLVMLDPANDEWAYMYFRILSNLAIAANENGNSAKAQIRLNDAVQLSTRYRNENVKLYKSMQSGIDVTNKILSAR